MSLCTIERYRALTFLLTMSVLSCSAPEAGAPVVGNAEAFRIGVLMDETGFLGDFGKSGLDGVRLALVQVNAAGGVLGRPVRAVSADTATDLEVTVSKARTLVDEEHIHAIVGPLGSGAAMAVLDQVAVEARIPMVSPTATSVKLTDFDDDGFFFRATAADDVQAPILADLAKDLGFERIAVFYQDDIYGQGMAQALAASFSGQVTRVPITEKESYLAELEGAAAEGAQALVAITWIPAAIVYLREALEHELFDQFLFVDSTASVEILNGVGAEALAGMKGTAPEGTLAGLGEVPTVRSRAFGEALAKARGRGPETGLEASAYDSAICLCLAVEEAGSTDGIAIRDALRSVCSGNGKTFGPGGVAGALAAIRAGKEVNFDGAGNTMEWSSSGDIARGHVVIWQFTTNGIEQVDKRPFYVDDTDS